MRSVLQSFILSLAFAIAAPPALVQAQRAVEQGRAGTEAWPVEVTSATAPSGSTEINIGDSANLDAFSRLRASDIEGLLTVQNQYGIETFKLEPGATGDGVVPVWEADDRMVSLTVAAGTGTSFLQSYEYVPYQPGKSQAVFITFVPGPGVAGVIKEILYGDAANGILLRQNGTAGLQLVRRTSTSGSVVEEVVNRVDWSENSLLSGDYILDETKAQILVIDLQFLGMGRVRIGFDIDGMIMYVHEFTHANELSVPYMQTASLPIGALVTATGSASPATLEFKCASVSSEGGQDEVGASFSTPEGTVTAASAARTHILSIRPKTTFGGIANRIKIKVLSVDLLVTGGDPVFWELAVGSTFTVAPSYSSVNATHSSVDYGTGGTITTAGTVIASGHVPATSKVVAAASARLQTFYPITLDRAGAVRADGTLSLIVTGIGGGTATRAVINYEEIR